MVGKVSVLGVASLDMRRDALARGCVASIRADVLLAERSDPRFKVFDSQLKSQQSNMSCAVLW
jgi:hypothetical protein